MEKPAEPTGHRVTAVVRALLIASAASLPPFLLGLIWWALTPGSSLAGASAFLSLAVVMSVVTAVSSGWLLGQLRELTELKRGRELELAGVRTSPDPIIHLDQALRIVALNPAAEAKFGHTGAAASGMPFTFLVPQPAAPAEPPPQRVTAGAGPRTLLSLDTQTSARRLAMRAGTRLAHLVQPMLGFTELALDGLDRDHAMRGDLEQIGRSSVRVVLLAQSLELFGGVRRPHLEPIELNGFLDRIEPELRSLLEPSTRLEFRKASEPVVVMADPGLTRTAVFLLVCNAEEAMTPGASVTIAVDQDGLRVSDSGPGIADEVRAALFQPLTSSKSAERGVGLGLAAARAAMRLQRADLHLESTGSGGTNLSLVFPAPPPGTAAGSGLTGSLATTAAV